MNDYIPSPINTDGVILTADMMILVDRLAKNAHDVWAKFRIQDGWTYGEHRDDDKKTHPCLVPYSELTDTEKACDIAMAEGVIKVMLSIGYEIKEAGSR